MIHLNVHEAKTHLSRHLSDLEKGEVILLCRRNVPVAEIRLLPRRKLKKKIRLGAAKGKIRLAKSFFEPLPESFLESFGL